jgi:hypothetical protein
MVDHSKLSACRTDGKGAIDFANNRLNVRNITRSKRTSTGLLYVNEVGTASHRSTRLFHVTNTH